ncbi:MAG: flippase [Deltaproteobacteria bacterium]|nr:flippase [Deltaproteobacteria bacterium]
MRMGVGLLVSVWVARYLGPAQFGMLSYATAFVALFGALATLGLDGIVVRELVRNPDDSQEILGTAFALRLAGGLLALLMAVAVASWLRHGEQTLRWLVAIIAAGAVFQAFDVIDFWFQANVLSKHTVMAKNAAFSVASLARVGLILSHAPLILFAGVSLLEVVLGAAGLIIVYRRNGGFPGEWRSNAARCRRLLGDSWPLILSGFSVAIYMKIDQVMLGEMAGDRVVGIYSSAIRISEIWYFLPMIIVSSVFPAVIQAKERDEGLYVRRMQRLFRLMTAISLAIAVPMTFLSEWVVVTLFGQGFAAAAPVLAIHIWAALFVFLGVAQGPWDLAENLTRLALFRISSGAFINVVLNVFLIPAYGAVGAAVATVVSQAFAAVFLNVVHVKTRGIFFAQLRSFLVFRSGHQ